MTSAVPKSEVSQDEAAIQALIDAIGKGHHDKDAAAIAAPYVPDAVISDLAPPLSRRGLDVSRKAAWLNTWEGPVERESRDFTITVSGDLAFCHGYFRLSGTPKMAGKPISFWMRATLCFHKERGTWRIVHEHQSVPFYMDGSVRPAFDLEP